MTWTEINEGFAGLFEQGGLILWAILLCSLLLWLLILERYWFHWRELPELRLRILEEWRAERQRAEGRRLPIRRVEALVSVLHGESRRNLLALHALTVILPLLGLLGTVSGMIKVFEVITIFGSGNTRGMAAGISEALVTTMAGLFTALAGIFFISDLENRADLTARRFEARLVKER